jgi:hypothetical protein
LAATAEHGGNNGHDLFNAERSERRREAFCLMEQGMHCGYVVVVVIGAKGFDPHELHRFFFLFNDSAPVRGSNEHRLTLADALGIDIVPRRRVWWVRHKSNCRGGCGFNESAAVPAGAPHAVSRMVHEATAHPLHEGGPIFWLNMKQRWHLFRALTKDVQEMHPLHLLSECEPKF